MELLNKIANKNEKVILGLMSGTSLDGLDLALCRISGAGSQMRVHLDRFATVDYPERDREKLAELRSAPEANLMELCLVHSWFGDYMGEIVNRVLKDWRVSSNEIDLIASHGQTIYHAPRSQHKQEGMPNATLQIGDGDHLAVKTGILTMSDFRQKHTASGGEGAPLAASADFLIFADSKESRILLNIGGIANFTWLPASGSFHDVLTTDTGPGNTLIDTVVQARFGNPIDVDGSIAATGEINESLLTAMMRHPYFEMPIPKTTGQELFNMDFINDAISEAGLEKIDDSDLVATVTRLTAVTIADAVKSVVPLSVQSVLYVSGGGVHNKTLIRWLDELTPGISILPFKDLGFNPDAKEAVLFAVLAYESLFGNGIPFEDREGIRNLRLGKLSFPA